MRKIFTFSSLLLIPFLFGGCAKERLQIGYGDPEAEMEKCLKLSEKKKFEEAIQCLEIFKSRFPHSAHSETAELRIGDAYFRKKEYLLAAESYQSFIKLHPTHPQLDYALYRTGLSYLKESPKAIDRDQEYLDDAIKYLESAAYNFPSSPLIELIRSSLKEARCRVAKRHFYIGRFYYRTGEYIAAIPRFIEVVNNYPDCGLLPDSLYRITIANIKLKRYEEAKKALSTLREQLPSGELTKRAEEKLLKAISKG